MSKITNINIALAVLFLLGILQACTENDREVKQEIPLNQILIEKVPDTIIDYEIRWHNHNVYHLQIVTIEGRKYLLNSRAEIIPLDYYIIPEQNAKR